jgi:DNA-binding LacI/PurR family transcriptional regulator
MIPQPAERAGLTMADVARLADVSVMTVSNVVNDRAERVSAETRRRVQAVIASTGYRVNVPARQLRQGRTGSIVLAVPDFASTYFGELGARLAERLRPHGFRLVLELTRGTLDDELATISSPHLDGHDAIILSMTAGTARDLVDAQPHKPLVVIGERSVPSGFDHVAMDNIGGARLATDALLDSGARRIAVIGGQLDGQESMQVLRTQGYRDALASRSVPLDESLVIAGGVGLADGDRAIRRLLEAGIEFDGVFGLTDAAALGAMSALAASGLRIPHDVKVVGWDNTELATYAIPPLTSVEPDNAAIADSIVRLLLRRLDDADAPAETATPPARLVRRESTRS